ncbi:hypothetical protein [Cohnella massiliensis]|uniref:hypothetical protein n=1 Tax=Cohnella massiliensis TaxID=1816691 RepID=UPI0009BB0E84|nr:hypothetical protein [Cohnella massiliensis]
MKKCSLLILMILLILLSFSKITEAKLSIIPPQDMIKQSSLIIIGTVTKKEYSEEQRQVRISVEAVVKGENQQTEITLKRDKPPMYGWLGFDFPEVGARIMVLLQQNDKLTLTGDVNAVAVLDGNNNVKLYKGSTMGQWTPERYEETYKAFLDEQSSRMISVTTDDTKGIMPAVEANQQSSTAFASMLIITGCIVATLFVIYRILKRNKQT